MPFFYLFWHSLLPAPEQKSGGQGQNDNPGSGVWALLMGSVIALIQFFLGSLVNPGGFGFSRWFSALVDVVSLPALIPLGVYFVLVCIKPSQNTRAGIKALYPGFTNFALLWLIPGAAIRAVSWSALSDPSLLVLAPLLWTALTVGMPLFFSLLIGGSFRRTAAAALSLLALPAAAAAAYWAFFSQRNILGFVFTGIAMIPMVSSILALNGKNSHPRDRGWSKSRAGRQ
jgi:hypothetical protein